MKNIITYLLLSVVMACLTSQTNAQVNLSTGLIAHWNFNGDANDISGKGNHGTVFGATLVAGKSGIPNTAYKFDGISNFIEVEHSTSLIINQLFSIHTLIKPQGFYAAQCHGNSIICKDGTSKPGNYALLYCDAPYLANTNCSTGVQVDMEHQNFYLQRSNVAAQAPYSPYIDNQDLTKWYALTGTSDGYFFKIYLNGQLVSTTTANAVGGTNTKKVFIGKRDDIVNPFWLTASIDEIRMYNRVLNQDEIDSLSNFQDVFPNEINEKSKSLADITISPNPVNDQFQLFTSATELNDALVQITDIHGRVLRTWQAEKLNNMTFDIADFVAGYYIVQISNREGSLKKKLIKF